MASTAANSAIDIAARALTLIGANPISSFSDVSTEALIANNMYEDVAQASLCQTRWRFATNQAVLNQLANEPTGRFSVAHQLPVDSIMVHAITVSDLLIIYSIYGDKVFSDSSTTDELVADYSFRADEKTWPSYFTLAVEYQLAAIFASSIARDDTLTQVMEAKAERLMAKARNLDSQQQTTRKLVTNRFKTERLST
jgi:hypothetical protein